MIWSFLSAVLAAANLWVAVTAIQQDPTAVSISFNFSVALLCSLMSINFAIMHCRRD